MGWNAGYRVMEATVIGAYNLGKLDTDLLAVLLEPYRDTDIDSGGSRNLKSIDGLTVEEVVIKVSGGNLPAKPRKNSSDQQMEKWYDEIGEKFSEITAKHGW